VTAVGTAGRELFQVVEIDLAQDENSQEIFETLNVSFSCSSSKKVDYHGKEDEILLTGSARGHTK
jgi:hypothetical protein